MPGNNTVTAILSTTWWNYFRIILDTLKSAGSTPLPLILEEFLGAPFPAADDSGLVAKVTITPFQNLAC